MFEFKATIPRVTRAEDGSETTAEETVTLLFRPYGDAPGRISRHNIGRIENAVWDYLEWGLTQPKNWPIESTVPGHSIFDEIPQRQITKCYNEWQAQSFEEESDDDEKAGGTG